MHLGLLVLQIAEAGSGTEPALGAPGIPYETTALPPSLRPTDQLLERVMKPERVQVGQKARRGGSAPRRPAAGDTKETLSDHKRARQAETSPDLEGPGTRPGAGHLLSIRATKESRDANDRAGSKAVMRRLTQETFIRCQPQIAVALQRCFTNPKTVLDCVRLLARLNGELP